MQVGRALCLPVLVGACLVGGCATSRSLRPADAGKFVIEASLPGTLIRTNSFVVPEVNPIVGGRYGLIENLELRADLHIGSLLSGVFGLDVGAIWHPLAANGWWPGVHIGGYLNVLTKPDTWGLGFKRAVRGAIELETVAHWEPLDWLWPYVVFENALMLEDGDYIGTLATGAQFWLGKSMAISVEIGWAAFDQPSNQLSTAFVDIGGQGALWFGLGLEYRGLFADAEDTDAEDTDAEDTDAEDNGATEK